MAIPALIAVGAIMAAAGIGGAISSGATGKSQYYSPDSSEFRNAISATTQDANWAGQEYGAAGERKGPYLNGPTMGTAAQSDYATYDPNSLNRSMEMESRGNQMGLAARLRDQMDGKGPSLAQEQLKQGFNQSLKAQMAAAGSARGGAVNAALAMRNLGNSADQMRTGMAGQANMLRLQEQMAAQGQYAGLTNAMRGQDLAWTQMQHQGGMMNTANKQSSLQLNSQLQQQMGLANMNADNQFSLAKYQGDQNTMALNDAQQRALLGYRGSMIDRGLTAEERNAQMNQDGAKMLYQSSEDQKRRNMALFGGLVGAGGSMMSSGSQSDERAKTDIKPGDDKLKSFYDALGVHSYKYKQPDLPLRGKGEYVSVMAQELEKTELGKHMVSEGENGKVVDYGKGFGAILAGQVSFHKRLAKIEEALTKGRK